MGAASSGAVSAPDGRQLVCADSGQKRSIQLACEMRLAGVRRRVSGHTVRHAFRTGTGLLLRHGLMLCDKPCVRPLASGRQRHRIFPHCPSNVFLP